MDCRVVVVALLEVVSVNSVEVVGYLVEAPKLFDLQGALSGFYVLGALTLHLDGARRFIVAVCSYATAQYSLLFNLFCLQPNFSSPSAYS